MKAHRFPALVLLALSSLMMCNPPASKAQTIDDQIEIARAIAGADRQVIVADAMQLTDAEAEKFWPLYHEYRADLRNLGDSIKHLVIEYAGFYPNVPEDRAKRMLKEMAGLESDLASKRAWYFKKFARFMPASKTLRFLQIENRLDLVARMELAASIPLVPIEGRFAAKISAGAEFVEGTVGGVLVQTIEMTAIVASIDSANRMITLVDDQSIKKTVRIGPDAVNFDQIRVGDRVTLQVTEELVVRVGSKADEDEDAALVALAPRGAKPGGVIAETVQVTGQITKIDAENRTATLQFEDGTSRTFPVRGDIDLGQRKVGDKVAFQVTEMVAIEVEKP